MKIKIVSSKEEIAELDPNERMVHLAFRASDVDLLSVIKRCPRLKAIQIPPSYHKTMSKTAKPFLASLGVELIAGEVWGHKKVADEYMLMKEEPVENIGANVSEGVYIEESAIKI